MGGKQDLKVYEELLKKGLDISKTGAKTNWSSETQVATFGVALLSAMVGFVPVGGPILSKFVDLLGAIFIPSQSTDAWKAISANVKRMIDAEITEYHLEDLRANDSGIKEALLDLGTAIEHNNKTSIRDQLRLVENNLYMLIPHYQTERGAVAALPGFAAVADIHLMLLANALNNKDAWDLPSDMVENFTRRYKERAKVGDGTYFMSSTAGRGRAELESRMQEVREIIHSADKNDTSSRVIDSAKATLAGLTAMSSQSSNSGPSWDVPASYVEYARMVYWKGFDEIRQSGTSVQDGWRPRDSSAKGASDGYKHSKVSEYESLMKVCVIQKALLWPYLLDDVSKVPQDVKKQLNEPIHYIYGRSSASPAHYLQSPTDDQRRKQWRTWTPSARKSPITKIRVKAYNAVDLVQVSRPGGPGWEFAQGEQGGTEYGFELGDSDYFTVASVARDFKIGAIKFKHLEGGDEWMPTAGNNHDNGAWVTAQPDPNTWQLSDIYVLQYTGSNTPQPGVEGIEFWFQPVLDYERL
ncbi:insecticidal delta-endotoxin Cry8Ea1 family protein [Streptomyces wuyuanensis]|uniref:insecticidal delta-endotoxin Cry8Ea1 family protein n=1 Tax=Streptomyces wuyuanensis TaxID=1196353 RepID=UPI003414FFF0